MILLRHGDCVDVLSQMPESSVGYIVSDPPYGLEFMGSEWDNLTRNLMRSTSEADVLRVKAYGDSYAGRRSKLPDYSGFVGRGGQIQDWHLGWVSQCFHVLKPGGVIKAFSATRTYHRMAAAMRDAGFVDLTLEAWTYGSGFPKSKNTAMSIDKHVGVLKHRGKAIPVAGLYQAGGGKNSKESGDVLTSNPVAPYTPISDAAKVWAGWGTNLKPAWEPVIVGRKPE